MTTTTTLEGGCLCRAVRYRATGTPVLRALCHCDSCRKASGAPMSAWIMFMASDVVFEGTPKTYASSDGCARGFCGTCGTSLSFTAAYLPGLIDLTIGSLDEPALATPLLQSWDSTRLPWLQVSEGIPAHAGFPPFPA